MTYIKCNDKFTPERRVTGKIDSVELAKLIALSKERMDAFPSAPPPKSVS